MARYKHIDTSLLLLAVDLQKQLLSWAPAYPQAMLLRVNLYAYNQGIVSRLHSMPSYISPMKIEQYRLEEQLKNAVSSVCLGLRNQEPGHTMSHSARDESSHFFHLPDTQAVFSFWPSGCLMLLCM